MKALDNFGREYEISHDRHSYSVKKSDIRSDAKYIEFTDEKFCADVGDDGYYAIADCDRNGSHLCKFTAHDDDECVLKQNLMPIFGLKIGSCSTLGIVTGMKQNFFVVVGVKDNRYYLKLRFEITAYGADEDLSFDLISLSADDGYAEMAKVYRNYQLERGACVTLKERVKTNKYLEYAVKSPEIRIRLAWKPAPAKVLEQTEENEPQMYIACNFERVMDFIDELKAQGVDRAQICLVGWNKSGHDGRYPQIFPVEEKLGGEQKLRELIAYAQTNGYQIVCHTNSTDCYSIADTFSEDLVIKNSDGSLGVNPSAWSGGRMYHLCPVKALEYAKRDLPKVAQLGFKGIHYIDVMSTVPLRECYDKNHPSDKKKTLECYDEIMRLCHEEFGGFASEGAFDFAAKYLDYAFYASFSNCNIDLFDEEIPFFELVYHGIILYNPSTETVNANIKGEAAVKKLKEYGGRPSFYIYSKFMTDCANPDWLGSEDLFVGTDEQMKYTVSKIKELYDDYKTEYVKQYEFMS